MLKETPVDVFSDDCKLLVSHFVKDLDTNSIQVV